MLQVEVLTLFPDMFSALSRYGVSARAIERNLLKLGTVNPRDFALDKHRTVDDKPYGGGPGMVMMVEPLLAALQSARSNFEGTLEGSPEEQAQVIYLSPQGEPLTQHKVDTLAAAKHLILVCGRYEGIDERFIERHVDEEISVGDYVVSGGELPAMLLLDAMIRQLPGALGSELSAPQDSFAEYGILDYPHFTRPERVDGDAVPDVLLSGDHAKIAAWRFEQQVARTLQRRPDLIENLLEKSGRGDGPLDAKQRSIIDRLKARSAKT